MRAVPVSALIALVLAVAAPAARAGVLFRDDFSDRGSGWIDNSETAADARGLTLYTPSGAYQMTPLAADALGFAPSPVQAPGADVRFAADVFLYAGSGRGGAGLVCRYRDHRNFYGFFATGDHRLMIVRMRDGVATTLAEGRYRGAIANTVDTRIAVQCAGDVLSIKVGEGEPVEVRDDALRSGQAGLAVLADAAAGTQAMFDDFILATAE